MKDNEYVELIEENYAAILEKYSDLKDDRLKWELIKMEITRLTISYSNYKEKQRRIRETELQKRLEGIKIFNSGAKITQFADDKSLICSSLDSVEKATQILNSSGLRLNPTKTKALWLGPWRDREEKPFGFKWPKELVRALGIFI